MSHLVFSTAVPTRNTINQETNIVNIQIELKTDNPSWLQADKDVEDSEPPNTNPSSGKEKDLNPGTP